MAYTDWAKGLAKLPKTAEFCLTDVTERISAGNVVMEFKITEALAEELDPSSRRGAKKNICRPRMFCVVTRDGDVIRSGEIVELVPETEKAWAGKFLRDFYNENTRLAESVLASLASKISVMSQASAAVLAGQLGSEVVKLITRRLSGEEVAESEASLKALLVQQFDSKFEKLVRKLRPLANHGKIKDITYEDGDLVWSFKPKDDTAGCEVTLTWKDMKAQTDLGLVGEQPALCVRDAFLFMVNLPAFVNSIYDRLAKILELGG